MSKPDKNLESYASAEGVRVIGPRLIDGQGYADALKFSNCCDVFVEDLNIIGGYEDCIDINRGSHIAITDVMLHVKGKYAVTIKGGAEVVSLNNVAIYGRGSEVDIDIGNWSDQSGERTRGIAINHVWRSYGQPVVVRVFHGDIPLVNGGNVRILDRRKVSWFYRLGKRWGIL